jgi:hypothetical protein
MTPYLATEDYGAGLETGVALLAQAFADEFHVSLTNTGASPAVAPPATPQVRPTMPPLVVLLIVVVVLLILVSALGRLLPVAGIAAAVGGGGGFGGWQTGGGGRDSRPWDSGWGRLRVAARAFLMATKSVEQFGGSSRGADGVRAAVAHGAAARRPGAGRSINTCSSATAWTRVGRAGAAVAAWTRGGIRRSSVRNEWGASADAFAINTRTSARRTAVAGAIRGQGSRCVAKTSSASSSMSWWGSWSGCAKATSAGWTTGDSSRS